MSQGIMCGFCLKSMDFREDRGKLEPINDADLCNHSFHYLCLVSSLLNGANKGESNCPFCNQLFKRIIPIPSEPEQQQEQGIIVIEVPHEESAISAAPTPVLISTESTTTTTSLTNLATSSSPTPSSVILENFPSPLVNSPSSSGGSGPSSPTKKPRKPKMKKCIYKDEATTQIPPTPKIKLFGQPFDRTCQICHDVHKHRMAKSRCQERHKGPYPCPLCGVAPFLHHSSLRTHHLSTHGIAWKPAGRRR